MEIKVFLWITLFHLPHILNDLKRIENTQSIGQHIALNRSGLQGVHHLEYIFRRIFHTIAPIFQIDIDLNSLTMSIVNGIFDVIEMLLRSLLQLMGTMLQRTFTQ